MGGVRVGFLGAGLISNMHLAFLAASSVEHTIVGVHDIVGERATAWAARTGAAVMTPDELLDAVDAVYVTTWTAAHPALVAAAAERGIAVFCEKPLGVSAPVVAGMVDVVEQAGIVNEVGLVLRAVPAWIHVRRLVADPRAGRLMAVTFRDDQYIPNQGRYASTWRVDRALAGRGALLEHSIHDVDVLRWVGGEVAAVSGTTREFHGHDGIDDVAVARLEFAAGGVAALTSVWHDVLERPEPALRRAVLRAPAHRPRRRLEGRRAVAVHRVTGRVTLPGRARRRVPVVGRVTRRAHDRRRDVPRRSDPQPGDAVPRRRP